MPMHWITWIILGLIAGFIASKIVNRQGAGILMDIVIGIVGAVVGGFIGDKLGLGGLEVGGENYIVPVDAHLASDRDVADEAVSLDRLMAGVSGARQLKLVILDACRENPFAASMRRGVAQKSVQRGLAWVEPLRATLVVYAAKDGEFAQDGDGANSPFAAALVKHLAEPHVEIDKMFRLVTADVLDATGQKQQPFVYGSLGREDYYFRP